ncbi:unnamed protein product [Heligmosomoides polygyrus]|uniref:DDA1 domain-containing protein n=1 Tax=Heligmosomoides polygyrus TaxID=6339 RepID=A0A183FIX5_HELPZ|nr:unnamed protein product [Heligmosomoides polygyrus]
MTVAEKIVLDCEQVRLLLLYEFKKQSPARVKLDNRCGTMGPITVSHNQRKHNTWEPRENVLDDRLFEEFQKQKQKNKKRSSSGSVGKKAETTTTTTPPAKKPRRLAGGDIRDESSESSEHGLYRERITVSAVTVVNLFLSERFASHKEERLQPAAAGGCKSACLFSV